jgi:hypothetical protein
VGGRQGGHAASVRILVALLLLLVVAPTASAQTLGSAQKLSGTIAGGQLGFDAADVGDLDGNGLDELVVGAPFANGNAGAAYLFYAPVPAGATLADADAVFVGADVGYVGEAIGAIGDLDDDGFDDLLLGAPGGIPGLQTTSPRPGEAYLLYGGPKRLRGTTTLDRRCLPTPCDALVTGIHESDFTSFGVTKRPAGDVDGDGHADLLIGAAGFAGYAGAAHLVYGTGERLRGTHAVGDLADATFVASAPAGFASKPMTGAGDLDGDGLDDLAISVTNGLLAGGAPGTVYVIYGNRTRASGIVPLARAGSTLAGGLPLDRAGSGLAAGDLDADGRDDLVVGVPGAAGPAQVAPSELRVVYGSAQRLPAASSLSSYPGLTAPAAGERLGHAIDLGDVDGDGRLDLVAGATGLESGRVYVLLGRPGRLEGTRTLAADRRLPGEAAADAAGSSIAVGRFTGAGRREAFAVGAQGEDTGGASAGALYLLR